LNYLFLTVIRVVQVELYCCATSFPHNVRHSCVYQTVGLVFVFPLQRSPCTVLSVIVSQLFPPRDRPCAFSFKILLQRWKQVTIDRRPIPWRSHIHCRIFCREISWNIVLFRDRPLYFPNANPVLFSSPIKRPSEIM